MTKTLDQQVRLWPPVEDEGSPTRFFADGAALHSSIARDFYRNVNNLQTHAGDKCFQFAFDAGTPASHRTSWTKQTTFDSSGEVFLGQLPLIIPHDALYLRWTLGIRRLPPAEVTISMDVSNIHFFIAESPCTTLDDSLMLDRSGFKFLSERVVSIGETSGSGGVNGHYRLVLDTVPGWANPIADLPGLQDLAETPIFWGIITADVSNATVDNEVLDLEDFSFWAAYG